MNRWLVAIRLKTLPAALVPVGLGCLLAWDIGAFEEVPALLCFAFALLVQIGTNFANDYFDGIKGTDTLDRLGPERAVAAGLIAPRVLWRATCWVLAVAGVVGLGLIPFAGWKLMPLGGVCLLCALAYTGGPFPLGYKGLGDVCVFVFFGLVAVMGTFFVQTGFVSWPSFWVGIGVGALSTNILAVNNFRDRETDTRVGKMTLAVRFGPTVTLWQYQLSFFLAIGACGILWYLTGNLAVCLPLALLPKHIRLYQRMACASTRKEFQEVLEGTVKLFILYGVLLGVGLLL